MTQIDGPEAMAAYPRLKSGAQARHLAQGTWPHDDAVQVVGHSRPRVGFPGDMRRSARALLVGRITAAQLADVLLALSEVVVNAIGHPVPQPDEEVVVHLAIAAGGVVRAEVCDAGPGFDPRMLWLSAPQRRGGGGGGLAIVDRVCTGWGNATTPDHCVWFEITPET
jgi:hypothetical protein